MNAMRGPGLHDSSVGAASKLVVVAAAVVLLTLGAGTLLQSKIDRLMAAKDASEHSVEVEGALQAMMLRLDRFDPLVNVYLATRMPGRLREAQNLGIAIETAAGEIATLVSGNPAQRENAARLNQCASQLAAATRSLASPQAAFPSEAAVSCREAIALMRAQERGVLEARARESQRATSSLLLAGLGLVCFSILLVVGLCGVLLRAALFRRRVEEQLAASNGQLARTVQVLEERAREAVALNDASDQLQMCLSAEDAYSTALHFVERLLPGSSGALCMIDNSRQTIHRRATWGDGGNAAETFRLDACCAMRSGQIRWRTPDAGVLHCVHFDGPPPDRYLCVPLVAHGGTLGVLYVECVAEPAALAAQERLRPLGDLAQLTSMTVAAINLRSKLETQSIRDGLTGLFNRHFMEISLEREIQRATRRELPLAIFMIDADNFKQFNDTFGHKAGDTVLRAIADCFLASIRAEDIVCRYGGEEFVVILPDISAQSARERAEQLRLAIGSLRVADRGQPLGSVSVSIGVAIFPQNGRTIEDLLQIADASLYAAKKSGRNRVVFAADTTHIPVAAK